MRFSLIEAERAHHAVSTLCDMLKVSRAGFYAWRTRPASAHKTQDIRLRVLVREAFERSRMTYGSPRIHAELRAHDERVSRKRLIRLMQLDGLVARQRRRYKRTTMSEHDQPGAPNLLDRRFEPEMDALLDALELEPPALASCYGAAARGIDLLGARAEQPTLRIVEPLARRPTEPVALVPGFNVHAKLTVAQPRRVAVRVGIHGEQHDRGWSGLGIAWTRAAFRAPLCPPCRVVEPSSASRPLPWPVVAPLLRALPRPPRREPPRREPAPSR